MKVLILGGDGFIGSHLLTQHINQKDRCWVMDINNLRTHSNSPEYTFIHNDIKNNNLNKIIKKIKPDLVYNCIAVATPSYYVKHPIETFNLDFLLNYQNICKPLLESKIPFIHFSTSEVYGKTWTSKYKEDFSNLTIGPTHKSRWIYATSKILLEQLLLSSNQNNFIIIRPQNFCGWDMDWIPSLQNNKDKTWIPRLPACFLDALMFNKNILVVRPGTQKRCYTHINDAVQGVLGIVNNWDKCIKDNPVYNIGNKNNEIDIMSLAKLYQQTWKNITGKKSKPIKLIDGCKLYGEGYEDSERRLFCDKKIRKHTGWKPILNIRQTVEGIVSEALTNYKIPLNEKVLSN